MINNPFSNLLKQIRNIFLWFLLIVVLTNILAPLYYKKPDEKFEETLKQADFTSDTQAEKESAALMTMKRRFCGVCG